MLIMVYINMTLILIAVMRGKITNTFYCRKYNQVWVFLS